MVVFRKLRSLLLATAFAGGACGFAHAADMFSPPPATPVPPSANEDWYLTIGASLSADPSYPGADNYSARPGLIFSIRKASQLNVFRSVDDNPSFAIFDTGNFRVGAVGRIDWGRDAGDSLRLTGLGNIDPAVEAGAFAEWYLTDWFRTRAELRYGVGGFEGIRGLLGADVILPYGQWRFAVGPRLTYGGSGYMSTYFGVTPLQSVVANAYGNPLPVYNASAGFDMVGAMAQLTYNFRNGFETGVFGGYGRLLGDAASSPLTTDANQFTAGVSLSYTFNIGKSWW